MPERIQLKPNQTILFTGDSITEAGRFGLGADSLGTGYVYFAANLILAGYPKLNLKVINTGIGGDTTRQLKARWNSACLSKKPDILSIMVGINDVWYANHPEDGPERNVGLAEYEDNYTFLLETVKNTCGSRMVLMQPFCFCADQQNPILKDLRKYIEVVNSLAKKYDTVLVPLQDYVDAQITEIPSEKWADDMVHPNPWVHAWIAEHWLKIIA